MKKYNLNYECGFQKHKSGKNWAVADKTTKEIMRFNSWSEAKDYYDWLCDDSFDMNDYQEQFR